MEIRDGLREWLFSIEDNESKPEHFLAFRDFCVDLFEEYGRMPPDEKINPRFVRGLLTCT